MTDVLRQLPKFSWRGIVVPLTSCKGSFEQDDVIHKFEFRDKELLEAQGVRNWRFSYSIPFREDLVIGPYRALFSRVLADFVLACRDRTPGQLYDPILGSFRAKVANFSLDTDPHKKDGSDATVDFIEAPTIGELDDFVAVHDSLDKVDAKSIDAQVALVDWKQLTPPEPTVDPLDAVDGFGREIQASGNRIAAALDSYTFKLQKIEDTIDELGDPMTWQLRAAVRRARLDALVQIVTGQPGANGNRFRTRTTNGGPIAVVAQSVGMDVNAFLALNQPLAQQPLVPQGTTIRYIQAA